MAMWDMVQQAQIRGLARSQGMGEADALMRDRRQEDRIDELLGRIEKLTDLVEAMWDVLVERVGVGDDDLVAALDRIHEARAVANQPTKCTTCGATVLRSDVRCQFCGADRAEPPAEPGTVTTF